MLCHDVQKACASFQDGDGEDSFGRQDARNFAFEGSTLCGGDDKTARRELARCAGGTGFADHCTDEQVSAGAVSARSYSPRATRCTKAITCIIPGRAMRNAAQAPAVSSGVDGIADSCNFVVPYSCIKQYGSRLECSSWARAAAWWAFDACQHATS